MAGSPSLRARFQCLRYGAFALSLVFPALVLTHTLRPTNDLARACAVQRTAGRDPYSPVPAAITSKSHGSVHIIVRDQWTELLPENATLLQSLDLLRPPRWLLGWERTGPHGSCQAHAGYLLALRCGDSAESPRSHPVESVSGTSQPTVIIHNHKALQVQLVGLHETPLGADRKAIRWHLTSGWQGGPRPVDTRRVRPPIPPYRS